MPPIARMAAGVLSPNTFGRASSSPSILPGFSGVTIFQLLVLSAMLGPAGDMWFQHTLTHKLHATHIILCTYQCTHIKSPTHHSYLTPQTEYTYVSMYTPHTHYTFIIIYHTYNTYYTPYTAHIQAHTHQN